MYQYDNENRKVPVEHYTPKKSVRFANTVEHYGSGGKDNKWLWIVLGVVAVLLLVFLVVMMMRKHRHDSVSLPDATAGFGFRFY